VRGADVGGREQIPLRIEPEDMQIVQNSIEPALNQCGHILDEYNLRANGFDDAGILAP